jgi:hypothetical protein
MDQTTATAQTGIIPKQGWSWGAFMLNFQFLIAIKKYKMLWWYLLALIPFLNIIFFAVFAIYLGVKGHELGTTGGQFASQAEYDGYMKATDHASKVMFIVFLIAIILGIILAIAGFSLGFLIPHMSTSTTTSNGYSGSPASPSTY